METLRTAQFFFANQNMEKVLFSKLHKEASVFVHKINELSMTEFHGLCEYCLEMSSAEVYIGFLKHEETCDLGDLSKAKYKSSSYTKKVYKKTLVELLTTLRLKKVIVWFYFNKRGER